MDTTFLSEQLVNLLKGGMAHMTFEDAVKDFPLDKINTFPPRVEYSFWHLIEHICRTQSDILNFMINPHYQALSWPKDYWPKKDAQATRNDWKNTIEQFNRNLNEIVKFVQNNNNELLSKIAWGEGQTFIREVQLVADHNAYHIGELGILRQVCNLW